MDRLLVIANQFVSGHDSIADVREFGAGNINDTYLVTTGLGRKFVLQRINQHVFKHPAWIMQNIRVYTEHIARRLANDSAASGRRWETPQIVQTADGQDCAIDTQGEFWRALSFIDGARTYAKIQDVEHAREVGCALGRFQTLISDLESVRLYDTLEGYHITPLYLAHYDKVLRNEDFSGWSAEVAYGMRFLAERRDAIPVLENAKREGKLRLRLAHGDPKVDNVMIDDATRQAVGLIDLDTIKPGLVQYDIGDCLRSGCNPLGEETDDIDAVMFDMDLCQAILEGYLPLVRSFYTENDYGYVYASVRLLAIEQGLRFFMDYLEGNVYYKIKYPENNLYRALVQFKLAESLEAHEEDIRGIVTTYRDAGS